MMMNKVWVLLFALVAMVNAADTLSFVIHADQNGGTGLKYEYKNCTTAKCILFWADSIKRDGYIFQGWTLQKDALDTFYVAGARIELPSVTEGDTVTFYAKWFEVKKPKKVNGCYQIANVNELYGLAYTVNGQDHFDEDNNVCAELTADIVVNKKVLNSKDSLGADAERLLRWVPIGESYHPFSGRINGKGHTISGLYFDNSQQGVIALVGYAKDSVIIDSLGIVDSYFVGENAVAGLVGGTSTHTKVAISNSYVHMTIKGNMAGGLVGMVWDSSSVSVSHSHYSGLLTHYKKVFELGGLIECVGPRSVVKIYDSYNEGNIYTFYHEILSDSVIVGGLVGLVGKNSDIFTPNEKDIDTLIIENSYNKAPLESSGEAGGLVGRLFSKYSVIKNSYNTGELNGLTSVGGLVEYMSGTMVMSNSYNSGALRGGKKVAGLIARIEDSDLNISTSYNTGNVVAFDKGYVGASGLIGILSESKVKVANSYNQGSVQEEYGEHTVKGAGLIKTQNVGVSFKNSYTVGSALAYDALLTCQNCEFPDMFENVFYETLTADDSVVEHSPEDFANGTIATLLHDFRSESVDGQVWGQKVGVDPYPVLNGAGVEGYDPGKSSISAMRKTAQKAKFGIYDVKGRVVPNTNPRHHFRNILFLPAR
jgi:uncharacterized repeat protein (TIGR02543 family)